MNHPLTDEICQKLAPWHVDYFPDDYERKAMRAAADWQLEQVIDWLKECPNYDLETYTGLARLIHDLMEAMRPQQQEDK